MRAPAALAAWTAFGRLAAPVAPLLLRRRLARGKEDAARLGERLGRPGAARPPGPLVWLHGASVGEGLAALSLVAPMRAARPDLGFLLTTGTVASAALIGPRLPERAVHQFAPLDAAPFLAPFLAHWRPDLAARVDSELWPATLWTTAEAGAPLALVNARISARSARAWGRAPGLVRALLGRFAAILAQDDESAARFRALGADPARVAVGGPLKAAAPPPEADPAALAALRAATAGRPVWLAASTHPGEEAMAAAAHRALAPRLPGLLTLVAPRHPGRGAAIAAEAGAAGLRVARRAAGQGPEGAELYVADTLGEMGLWLRLAPVAFMGGSTAALGGHNPWEPAALGVLILRGPDVANFAEPYAALDAAGAARVTPDAASLAAALAAALRPDGTLAPEAAAAAAAGRRALAPDPGPARRAAAALLALLPAAR